MKRVFLSLVFVYILTACGSSIQAPKSELPFLTDLDAAPTFEGGNLPADRGDYFAGSGSCVTCHKDMRDADGNDVSMGEFWRGTMMGNAARDPYWQAALRAETLETPGLAAEIEDTCTNCHMPMARTTSSFAGSMGQALDDGYFKTDHALHTLGIEGVSCTLCHQIEDQHLGEEESFDGGYVIDSDPPSGERINYGPYESAEVDITIMQSGSGYLPKQGLHIQSSEVCATCHTLYTPTVDANGEVVGVFPEQMPYEEWLASDYANDKSCQDCHMPEAEGEISLSVTGSTPRAPFSKHSFVGGNTYALLLLRKFGPEIGLTANSDHLDAALARAVTQLENESGQIEITEIQLADKVLDVTVDVKNQVGHKFPSGYPSRRVWIHLLVQDHTGTTVFESGGWTDSGMIQGNANDEDPLAFEPHYQIITAPDEVQIFEAIFVNTDGEITTTLLRGNAYIKDNRLLPAGFDKDNVSDDIAVMGQAKGDADFLAKGDTLQYRISLEEVAGPYTVTAELVYQSIGYRWAEKMNDYEAPETQQFAAFSEQVSNLPVLVSSASQKIGR